VRRSSDKKEILQKYNSTNYPQDIHKKTLVQAHFRKHFELSIKENPVKTDDFYKMLIIFEGFAKFMLHKEMDHNKARSSF